jgi:hypothetical protein
VLNSCIAAEAKTLLLYNEPPGEPCSNTVLEDMQALKVAGRCGRASQHNESVSRILSSAETFGTADNVVADMKVFLEEDEEGPNVVTAISAHCTALGRDVLSQVIEDMSCMDVKDARVGNVKDFLSKMSKRHATLYLVPAHLDCVNVVAREHVHNR